MNESVAWPNIALLDGRLLGLGTKLSLPSGLFAFDVCGRLLPVGGRQARIVDACVATSPEDREWLQTQLLSGQQAVAIASHVFFLPPAK